MSRRRTVSAAELSSPLLGYGEAVQRILDAFEALPASDTPLAECTGLVLAQDVCARVDVPAFDNSAMDGYAARSSDASAGAVLVVADHVGDGVTTKVMTGQPIPSGADCVLPWEDVTGLDDAAQPSIRVEVASSPGRFVRPRGGDVAEGDRVLRRGQRIGPVELGVLAALGCSQVPVHRRPRVAVLASGDELVGTDDEVGSGRVRDANTPMLVGLLESYGATLSGTARVEDDPERIAAALERLASQSDLVVTTGGASVGEHDWMSTILAERGSLDMWRVAMRPGKPIALGRLGTTPVIVLPGNPGSVIATSHVVLGRAVRRLRGEPGAPETVTARLAGDIEGDEERTLVHPVRLVEGDAVPVPMRSSQVMSNAIGLDGFVVVAPGGLHAGAEVQVERYP